MDAKEDALRSLGDLGPLKDKQDDVAALFSNNDGQSKLFDHLTRFVATSQSSDDFDRLLADILAEDFSALATSKDNDDCAGNEGTSDETGPTERHVNRLLNCIASYQEQTQWKAWINIWFESEDDSDDETHCIEFRKKNYEAGENVADFWRRAKNSDKIVASITLNKKDNCFFLRTKPSAFEKSASARVAAYERLRDFYCDSKMSEEEVKSMLEATLKPFELSAETKIDIKSPVSNYICSLVGFEPQMREITSAMEGAELKSKVIAIAGESGSGKTTFAVEGLLPTQPRFCVKLETKDFDNKPLSLDPPESSCLRLIWAVILCYQERESDSQANVLQILHQMRSMLNRTRNEWSQDVLVRALRRTSLNVANWFSLEKACEQVSGNILFIVDEAGKDMDFVHGIVDSAEAFLSPKREQLGMIRLVLCGTRLDAIKTARGRSFVGSDPLKSLVVEMQETQLDELRGHINDKGLIDVVKKGTYSKILGTNVRILTKILLPFLNSKIAGFRKDHTTRASFQIAVASSWLSMAFVPTAYFNLNGLGDLTDDETDCLLKEAFKFFATKSLLSRPGLEVRPGSLAIDPTSFSVDENQGIFNMGLATLNGMDTPAIKFLACDGLVASVIKADGNSFEQALVLHLCRLFSIKDRSSVTYTLRGAWPPAALDGSEKNPLTLWEDPLDGYHRSDIENIVGLMRANPQAVIILRQGVPNAQGPDVMDLCLEDDSWVLDLYQSKNELKPRTPGDYAETLGVRVGSSGNTSVASEQDGDLVDKPFRAQSAIARFCAYLAEGVGEKVIVRNRVVVWIGQWPGKNEKGSRLRDVYQNSAVELWTREFLSPTIDCVLEPQA